MSAPTVPTGTGFWFEGLRVYRRDGLVHLFLDMGGTDTPDHWTLPDDAEDIARLLSPLVAAFPNLIGWKQTEVTQL